MERNDVRVSAWKEYELLDSGDHAKLERYGNVIIARPETQAVWGKKNPAAWEKADALFRREGEKGTWKKAKSIPETWTLSWGEAKFSVRLTNFKHTGVFPEQEPNWRWIEERTKALSAPKVLNLFGYTGIASLVAAQAGAIVTHVDSSKQSLSWAKENAELSSVPEGFLRYIPDDAAKFSRREVRRGAKYDGIILDPPAFGRGAKGEVWKIEEGMRELMQTVRDLLSEAPGSFLVLNGYAAGYSAYSFAELMRETFPSADIEFGELLIPEKGGERVLPSGIFARFSR